METNLNLNLKEAFGENCKTITYHRKQLLICVGRKAGGRYLNANPIQVGHLEILAFYLVLLIVLGFFCWCCFVFLKSIQLGRGPIGSPREGTEPDLIAASDQ